MHGTRAASGIAVCSSLNFLTNPNMSLGARLLAVLLFAGAFAVVGEVAMEPAASADGGCIANNVPGQVPRNARPGDMVCAPSTIAQQVQKENASAATGVGYASGGADVSKTCVSGLVWREAFDGDTVCVTPARRTDTWQENANAGVGPTGGLQAQVLKPPAPPQVQHGYLIPGVPGLGVRW